MQNNHIRDGPSTSKASSSRSDNNLLNNSFNSGSTIVDNEIERRRTAYKSQTKIKDEMRKAEQGISCETNISRLFNEVEEQQDMENVENLRTMKADGQTLEQLTKLSITELDRMRNETAKTLDPELFIARMKVFANKTFVDYANEGVFISFGKRCAQLMRCVPDFYYLRPCFELSKRPNLREKTKRKFQKRIKLEQQEVKAKTLRQLQEEEVDKTSVSKELDNIKKHLRAFFKENASDQVDYYRFVLSPDQRIGFGETIENMFYVSFLVKDGGIRLRIVEDGLPHIVKISREERAQRMQHNEFDTTQVIGLLDHPTWKKLVQKLGVQKAYIKRRPAAPAEEVHVE